MLARPRPSPARTLVTVWALCATLTGCGDEPIESIPKEHTDLVGTWVHGELSAARSGDTGVYALLVIRGDGSVSYAWYERGEHARSCSVVGAASITEIAEDGLTARVLGPMTTELAIDLRPRERAGRWTMTVAGVELERLSPVGEHSAAGFECADGDLVGPEDAPSSGGRSGSVDYDGAI